MEYASNGKGNLGVTLGAVGTGLGLLDGGANLIGRMLGGGNGGGRIDPEDKPVTRYDMGLIRESINQQIENSYLRGQLDTATKFEGVQRQFAEQMAFNATVSGNVSAVAQQTADLRNNFDRLTRVYVPNENLAPGYGFASVQPMPFFPQIFPMPAPPQTQTQSSSTGTTTG